MVGSLKNRLWVTATLLRFNHSMNDPLWGWAASPARSNHFIYFFWGGEEFGGRGTFLSHYYSDNLVLVSLGRGCFNKRGQLFKPGDCPLLFRGPTFVYFHQPLFTNATANPGFGNYPPENCPTSVDYVWPGGQSRVLNLPILSLKEPRSKFDVRVGRENQGSPLKVEF